MRFVSGEEIRRVLTFPALIKAMEASHRRARMETRDVLMGPEAAHYFVRSATDHGRASENRRTVFARPTQSSA